MPAGTQRAVVVQVNSGDSVQLTAIEPGDALPELRRVDAHLLDIRAPRPGECLFDEATDHLRQLAPVGTAVWVRREPRDDQDGHRLHVWTEAGRFTNAEMVRSGLAEVRLDSPGSPHRSEISLAADRGGDARADLQERCGRTEAPGTTTSAQPSPQPQPEPEPSPRPDRNDEDGGAAHYSNCSAAKAAGAAPLHRGDPGYRSKLDRDGDGVACET